MNLKDKKIKQIIVDYIWPIGSIIYAVLLIWLIIQAITAMRLPLPKVSLQDKLPPEQLHIIDRPIKPDLPDDKGGQKPAKDEKPTKPDKPTGKPQVINGKIAYLTFDDGPSVNTGKVLDVLDKYGVKATFFVTGSGRQYGQLIKRAFDSGHSIGLHTYTHNYSQIYSSDQAYLDDLHQISNMVKDITGTRPALIRFPGGSSNTISANYSQGIMSRLVGLVRSQGYQYYDWNCSSEDASGNNVPVDRIIESSKCPYEQVVLLMHDANYKETTVEALPKIIEYYQSNGYQLLPLTLESYPAHHRIFN